jgi:hypothetical protein
MMRRRARSTPVSAVRRAGLQVCGAIWNAGLFGTPDYLPIGDCIFFRLFSPFNLSLKSRNRLDQHSVFFQATGSEEVLLDCEFRRDRELLDRPKAFKNAFLHWRISSKFFERFFLACRSKNRRINLE